MRRYIALCAMLCGCAPRASVIRHVDSSADTPLLGTWKGALETNPVIFRVFGQSDHTLHAELEVLRPDGAQRYALRSEGVDQDPLTFAAPEGVPICSATVDGDRLFGLCEVEPGGRKRQWLVVRP